MEIWRSGLQSSGKDPAEYFTGTVRIDPLFQAAEPARALGEKHWHGAASTAAMTHIAIVEQLDGKAVEWMERVSDEEYAAASRLQS